MAREIAISKKLKISEAQEYMLLSVLGASVCLGVAISLSMHFVQQIAFNAKVIAAEDKAIVSYTNVIKNTGICRKPEGDVYTEGELTKCNPDSIEVSEVPGTLRANILESLAANEALNSVPKEDSSTCINPSTGKNYTYAELNDIYDKATGASELTAASQLIKSCSALRVIPDALPIYKNEEALLASLNKLFIESGWLPQSISPGGSIGVSSLNPRLNMLSVSLAVEADTGTTMKVLDNIERSIREFDISKATIEWGGDNTLTLYAQANAYYTSGSSISEITETVKVEDKK